MNKLFGLVLFLVGVGLVVAAACANSVVSYVNPNFPLLDTWGIVWRIALDVLLILIGVGINNLESFASRKSDF